MWVDHVFTNGKGEKSGQKRFKYRTHRECWSPSIKDGVTNLLHWRRSWLGVIICVFLF
jgi:hypothetical protein